MSFRPDPGGVFASDTHRRVMANLPNPDEVPLEVLELVTERIRKDDHLNISTTALVQALVELEADGFAEEREGFWRNTDKGFAALTGPVKEEA